MPVISELTDCTAIIAGVAAPLLLAVLVMLLMQKHPGLVIWMGMFFCVATMLADTLLSFVKAGKIGSLAVGSELSADVPEGELLHLRCARVKGLCCKPYATNRDAVAMIDRHVTDGRP